MSQTVENIKPSYPLFRDADYKENLARKQETYEERHPMDKIRETFEWSTTKEYQDLNFAREALTVNPAKARITSYNVCYTKLLRVLCNDGVKFHCMHDAAASMVAFAAQHIGRVCR